MCILKVQKKYDLVCVFNVCFKIIFIKYIELDLVEYIMYFNFFICRKGDIQGIFICYIYYSFRDSLINL